MRMRFMSTLPAVLLAVIAVVLAVTGLVRYNQEQARVAEPAAGRASPPDEPPAPRYTYLFATKDLAPGTELTPDLFTRIETPVQLPGALTEADVPFGQTLAAAVKAGRPLTEDAMVDATPLQQVVAEGMRAMAFELDPLTSVGGLLRPGDRVDIMATFRGDSRDIAVSSPLLEQVQVLAIRGAIEPDAAAEEDDRRRNATMVLAIPEAQVGRVALAAAEARLQFVASSPDAGTPEAVAGTPSGRPPVFLADIRPLSPDARARKKKEAAAPSAEKEKPGLKVQVFEGSDARTVYVR